MVIVQADIDSDGRVTALSVVEGGQRFREAALAAAHSIRYEKDCDEGGRPIPSSRRVVVWFGPDGKLLKTEGERVIRVGDGVQSSKLRHWVKPDYPAGLKRARIQGLVLLRVRIDKEGNPTSVEPVRGHALLIPLAVAAVQKWKWAPTYVRCEPVPVIATATVNFVIP